MLVSGIWQAANELFYLGEGHPDPAAGAVGEVITQRGDFPSADARCDGRASWPRHSPHGWGRAPQLLGERLQFFPIPSVQFVIIIWLCGEDARLWQDGYPLK